MPPTRPRRRQGPDNPSIKVTDPVAPNPNASPRGKKTVPEGYRNYGQYRSEQVQTRNAARKAAAGDTLTSYKRPKKRKPRFGATETVSGAVAQRSGARLAALGGTVKGVDGSDGYTGAEARKIKRTRRRQKASRTTYSI